MTTYAQLEDAYVERLRPLVDEGVAVQAMPDNKRDLERIARGSRVTVSFGTEYAGDRNSPGRPEIKTLGLTVTENFLEFMFTVEATALRGSQGAYQVIEWVKTLLTGWTPTGGRATAPLRVEYQHYENGIFVYQITAVTSRHSVPAVAAQSGVFGGLGLVEEPEAANFDKGTVNLNI